MKKIELVYRYILKAAEHRRRTLSQAEIAKTLSISLSTVHHAMQPLMKMGAVSVQPRSFSLRDARKILMLWASIRNIEKDIVYTTHADMPVREIEKTMPPSVMFAAYSAYRLTLKDVPADYSEVYVYGDEGEVKRRFPPRKGPSNILVLKKQCEDMTLTNIFVDLWNLKEWYAKDYLNALERRLDAILA